MSEFQKRFEKAVAEISAQIDNMSDVQLAGELEKYRDSDLAQILREVGVYPAALEEAIPVFEGTFSTEFVHGVSLSSQFQVTQVIIPELITNPEPPQACLIAA